MYVREIYTGAIKRDNNNHAIQSSSNESSFILIKPIYLTSCESETIGIFLLKSNRMLKKKLRWFIVLSILSGFSICSCFSFSVSDQSLAPKYPNPSSKIHLCATPLIGGPRFLPLHFQLVLEREDTARNDDTLVILDFIPQNATDKRTLVSLLTGKSVEGEIRYMEKPRNQSFQDNGGRWIVRTWKIPLAYEDSQSQMSSIPLWYKQQFGDQLSLIENNCLTFALLSLRKLQGE